MAALHCLTDIPVHTIQRILTKDLQLKKRTATFVPALLTPNHLRQRLDCGQSMLRMICNNPNVMTRLVTMDKTWVYMYDPESKAQSAVWLGKGKPRPSKPKHLHAIGKCMLVSFCDWKGMIHHEFVCG